MLGLTLTIKVSNKETLMSMKQGDFWFRHPAYYNHAENKNGDSDMGDRYDNKLKSITTNSQFMPEGNIRVDGPIKGKNLPCEVKTQLMLYNLDQDINRQISFYKCPKEGCNIKAGLSKYGLYIRCNAGHYLRVEEI